ncbi:hypothetical protein C2855_21600 [Aeromonas bestiarum]|uniref:hypothetical protein n=1 Tax=Aeromonas bestiarum TaxID=105751 RepID=UPI000CD41334|nr:hypothetical protein [Aeromonas bestiarum]POG21182.1 hypothetical protein C2855_21600 [Aeromonas bestiarum]
MPEQQYGPQILLEAQALYQAMEKGKTNYGRREVSDLITQHVPSLANTPKFGMELSSLVLRRTGWGRRVFINQLFDLISGHFEIEAPHDVAPVNAWAVAPEPVNLVVDTDDILDLDLLGPDSPPWE